MNDPPLEPRSQCSRIKSRSAISRVVPPRATFRFIRFLYASPSLHLENIRRLGLPPQRVDAGAASSRRSVLLLKERHMLDFILLAAGLGFFALSIAYTYACDWL